MKALSYHFDIKKKTYYTYSESAGETTEAVPGAAEPAWEGDSQAGTAVGWVWGWAEAA